MTYNDFLIKITETIKIRSANYRLTQNDIIFLTNNVYSEIARDLPLYTYKQEVLMDSRVDKYDLDALYTGTDNSVILGTYKILDNEDANLGTFFTFLSEYVCIVKPELESAFYNKYDGEKVYFYRHSIKDIETLNAREQTLYFDVIINGIMYYTHTAIPNPTASDSPHSESNSYYQIYMRSKENLLNQVTRDV